MLKLGGSVYPMEAVRRTGVDMADPRGIETVMLRFAETIAEMERLLEVGQPGIVRATQSGARL
jgi:oligoendopeptidase F